MRFDPGKIEMWQQVIGPVTTAGTQDGTNVVALEHLLEFAGAALDRSGKIEIALEDGVEIKRSVSGAGESRATGVEVGSLNIAGGRDDSDRIAGAKRGRLDELGIRSWHRSDHNVDGKISPQLRKNSPRQINCAGPRK